MAHPSKPSRFQEEFQGYISQYVLNFEITPQFITEMRQFILQNGEAFHEHKSHTPTSYNEFNHWKGALITDAIQLQNSFEWFGYINFLYYDANNYPDGFQFTYYYFNSEGKLMTLYRNISLPDVIYNVNLTDFRKLEFWKIPIKKQELLKHLLKFEEIKTIY
jgi:hypothetical protein